MRAHRSGAAALGVVLILLGSCTSPESPSPKPQIAIAPGSLTFTTTSGVDPASQSVVLANSGDGELVWSISDDASWLSASPSAGVGGATATVSVAVAGLAVGTHTAALTVTADGASNSPRTVGVTLTIMEPPPTIAVAPSSLSFSATQDGANPNAQTISISNDGGGTLAWTASDDASWLSLSAANGTGAATVTVSVNTTGLAAGTHDGTITIAATGATNTPRTVAVTLTLAADYSGSWAGTTSQDSTITMQISNNAITQLSFGFRIASCGVTGRTTTTFNTPVDVASGSLSESAGAFPLSYTITGTFSSSTAVAGTLTLNWNQGGCSSTVNATWSASRP